MSTVITQAPVQYPRVTSLDTLLAWFDGKRRTPTYQDVMTRFGCSRPTAFRWLALYRHRQAERQVYLNEKQPPARNLSDSLGVSAADLAERP